MSVDHSSRRFGRKRGKKCDSSLRDSLGLGGKKTLIDLIYARNSPTNLAILCPLIPTATYKANVISILQMNKLKFSDCIK